MEILFILIFSYMVILLEKSSTVNLGDHRSAFTNIDLCKQKQVYAPFKYRVLGFWIARLFNVTSDKIKTITVWTERYSWNVYLLKSDGVERYYVFKYTLLLLCNFIFYWYLSVLELPALSGVIILDMFLALTFIYDAFDYLIEISLYGLFLIGAFLDWHFSVLFFIATLGSLNRESSIFMLPISFFYCSFIGFISVTVGFIIGFAIPRIIYREPVDNYDRVYTTPWKFLVFNPFDNWKRSIWPRLKMRFSGFSSTFFILHNGHKINLSDENNENVKSEVKNEYFLNRIFLGVSAIAIYFLVILWGIFIVPDQMKILGYIFLTFVVMISLPADIREIRVYCPALYVLVPYILYLS